MCSSSVITVLIFICKLTVSFNKLFFHLPVASD